MEQEGFEIEIDVDDHDPKIHEGIKLFLIGVEDKSDGKSFLSGVRSDRKQEQGVFSNELSEPVQVIKLEDFEWHFTTDKLGDITKEEIDELLLNGHLETERFKMIVVRNIFGEGFESALDSII